MLLCFVIVVVNKCSVYGVRYKYIFSSFTTLVSCSVSGGSREAGL